jgi:hypothetical protein
MGEEKKDRTNGSVSQWRLSTSWRLVKYSRTSPKGPPRIPSERPLDEDDDPFTELNKSRLDVHSPLEGPSSAWRIRPAILLMGCPRRKKGNTGRRRRPTSLISF